ncbi:divergent PAP2 family protein [Alicyclobacillus tolerans]|uniref:Acid phosphatase family membrane protein YuiD n=1 Tax=Alicyclobacillus tolerans TaxID=90970 RepID=A0ABT9LTA2_9BACL|nr:MULTISPECIES: divergent PAP2 family protein [Alicyclobacillus]MDP9727495.1 acid phosphatase family membrane protein YuiD [Alicyclobacillus tengchongensis]QRF23941.1 divergent PAP2 family protein [Alicyclobacillus sp. TC]
MIHHDLVSFLEGLWRNAPLMAALVGICVGQILKIPIHYFRTRQWELHKIIDAGGMPSSHAAGVMALTTALAYVVGPQSPIFATSVVFTAIVMYDAGGIRRHAGEHAVLLNRIAMELSLNSESDSSSSSVEQEGERLKEILGHEPQEVILGAVIGLLIGIVFGKWWIW